MRPAVLLLLLYSLSSPLIAEQTITFSAIANSMNSLVSEKVMREAYAEIDLTIKIKPVPGKRALEMSNAGEADGELFRIGGIAKQYPNLIQIPTPINQLEGVAISARPHKISAWTDLSAYRIGIQRGIKFVERGVGSVKGLAPQIVNNNPQLIELIEANRIDIAVLARLNAINALNSFPHSPVMIQEEAIQVYPLYHYLHKKNKAIAQKITSVLQSMDASGRIKQIRSEFIATLRKTHQSTR